MNLPVKLRDGRHPVWIYIRGIYVVSIGLGVLWVTATMFDSGEVRAAMSVATGTFIFDFLKRKVTY